MIPKESRKIHRPDCRLGNRSPLLKKARQEAESMIWRDLGYESPEAYMAWLKRVSSRDGPLSNRNNGDQVNKNGGETK